MAKAKDQAPPADDITPAAEADPRDAEITRLKSELAAARGPDLAGFAPGQRFKVTLLDAPTAIVAPKPGQHPWERYKEVTGVIASANTPSCSPTDEFVKVSGEDRPEGIVRPTPA